MTPNEIKRRYPHASSAFIRANTDSHAEGQRKSPQPQRSPSDVALVKDEDKKDDSKRITISYRVFRSRFCDPDNLLLKWHTDALRYEGLIKDDRYEDIEIRVQQFKSKEEYVEIKIVYP